MPEEYQEVEYIESTGTQYLDTKIVTNNNSKIVIQAQATDANIGTGYRLFGSRTGAKIGNFISTNNGKVYVDYGGSSFEASLALDNGVHVYNLDKNKFYYDGVLLKEWNVVEFSSPSNAYLFGAYHDGGIVIKPWRIWYCRLYDNDVLVRDLVPCYRKSDNTIGMYDIVSGAFFTNAGTGEFLKGINVLTSNSAEYASVATLDEIPTNYVDLESEQTITGKKTFNERPVIIYGGTKIPEEYQEVEYIESDGTQYINTGLVIPTTIQSVEYQGKLQFLSEGTVNTSIWGSLNRSLYKTSLNLLVYNKKIGITYPVSKGFDFL